MFKWFKKKEIVETPKIDQHAVLRQMQRVITMLDDVKDSGHFVYTIPELAPNVVPAGVTPLIAQDSSLPHRQLRRKSERWRNHNLSSLPHRQLRSTSGAFNFES